jgi:hypothetical protein
VSLNDDDEPTSFATTVFTDALELVGECLECGPIFELRDT